MRRTLTRVRTQLAAAPCESSTSVSRPRPPVGVAQRVDASPFLADLHEEKDGKENVIEFDFLGKDSIRYYNCVAVERQVFKNVRLFMKEKTGGDDLFDRLTVRLVHWP